MSCPSGTSATPNTSAQVLPLPRNPNIALHASTPKGRALYATAFLPAGTHLETSPVLVFSADEAARHLRHTLVHEYTFGWPAREDGGEQRQALPLGLGSLFNHATRPVGCNVGYVRDVQAGTIAYRTVRDVQAGEELCIDYGEWGRRMFGGEEEKEEEEGVEEAAGGLMRMDVEINLRAAAGRAGEDLE